jgi:hypothetical protein
MSGIFPEFRRFSKLAVKKLIVIIIITTLAFMAFAGGCVTPSDGTPARIKTWGTVADNTSTGGFYSIITDNGTRYVPVNFNTSTARPGMEQRSILKRSS